LGRILSFIFVSLIHSIHAAFHSETTNPFDIRPITHAPLIGQDAVTEAVMFIIIKCPILDH